MLAYFDQPNNRKKWNIDIWALFILCSLFLVVYGFRPRVGVGYIAIEKDEHPALKANAGEFSVLTYNIAGLPELISSAQTPRATSINQIGRLINRFDIVNVQEDFNYNQELYKHNEHPHRTQTKGAVPFGDGLNTLSKFAILAFERIAWKDCNGSDCLTPKGFSFARLQLADYIFLDVYNVHTTAQDNPASAKARQQNMRQFATYVAEKSACQPLLIMGDFNAHYAFHLDNIKDIQEELHLLDTWVILQNNGKFPIQQYDFKSPHALEVTNHCESIDKIYYRNSDKLLLEPHNYRVELELFANQRQEPLSDHCAVAVDFSWKLNDAKP